VKKRTKGQNGMDGIREIDDGLEKMSTCNPMRHLI
jgi:hypothetical protein